MLSSEHMSNWAFYQSIQVDILNVNLRMDTPTRTHTHVLKFSLLFFFLSNFVFSLLLTYDMSQKVCPDANQRPDYELRLGLAQG